jgi:hypothetical protein
MYIIDTKSEEVYKKTSKKMVDGKEKIFMPGDKKLVKEFVKVAEIPIEVKYPDSIPTLNDVEVLEYKLLQQDGNLGFDTTNYADNNNQNIKSAEDAEDRIKKVRSEAETAQKSQVGAIVQAQGAAKHAGGIMDLLYITIKLHR